MRKRSEEEIEAQKAIEDIFEQQLQIEIELLMNSAKKYKRLLHLVKSIEKTLEDLDAIRARTK